MMKRLMGMFLCLALLLTMVPAVFAQTGVVTEAAGFGGGGSLVYLDMTSRSLEAVTSGNNVSTDAPAQDLVKGSVAAVNGGFFNSYYSGAGDSFPGNYPAIYGALTQNGEIINAGGSNNCLAFTYDGKILIDRTFFQTVAVVHGRNNFNVWGVNKMDNDPTAISLFTPKLTLPFTTPADATVYTVKDGKIISALKGGSYTVPAGCKVLVFNKTAADNATKWQTLPVVGDKVEFAYTYAPGETADQASWKNVKTAVSGGRMLVMNGKNVTADTSYNASFDNDAKQSNTSSALRSFAAVMKDGRLVLGTASGTFPQIAAGLIAKGAVRAVSFDGGGSSMLYTKDKGFLTPAGRQLTCVLTVVDKATPDVKPVQPDIPVVDTNPNAPSAWAKDKVEEAKSLNLVPQWMWYGYKKPATRAEFCALLVSLIPTVGGKSADQIRTDLGIFGAKFDAITFTDTDLYNVRLCASLGIVDGFEDGSFKPNASLTREQAATMLQRTANLLGQVVSSPREPFADDAAISGWAREGVEFVTSCGIMNGLDGNRFAPKGTYTKEQAIVTMLNAHQSIHP